ncbi:MutS family DNA mismatch repair protein [Flavihumibacter cheonanensis]|uniref:MutS-related protein n=1 Tax=Flavihumibacter cheonanensis TaxID=1442385 RepID=UPI001EF89320|nr:hypothetical protein [Flavihumibacter cheonanensis]MCG7752241.1 hypothetical protein [Flavihumibacter cheonanensis]
MIPKIQIYPSFTAMLQDPNSFYSGFYQQLNKEKQALTQKRNRIAIARVITICLAAFLLYQFRSESLLMLSLLFCVALAIFLFLVKFSLQLTDRINLLSEMIRLTNEENRIAQHKFLHRFEGNELAPPKHPYAGDLDLFGKASLFQFLHRTTSEAGHQQLAQWLLEPASTATILARQEATKNLASLPAWSLQFEGYGHQQPIPNATRNQVLNWSATPSGYFPKTVWKLLRYAWPTLAIGLLVLHLFDQLPSAPFYGLILLLMTIAFYISKGIVPIYRKLDAVLPSLTSLSNSLHWVETAKFETDHLKTLQSTILDFSGTKGHVVRTHSASRAIKSLHQILDRFDYRHNPLVYIPLNTLLLWDLQQVWALEKWKHDHQSALHAWFQSIAELEALNSLGRFSFNHPSYTFPLLSEIPGHWTAAALGHPLIPAGKCVTNEFSTSGRPAIALITGSNMAGKSTFLRSIGVNQVLAMAGAPVFASHLTTSNMRIMSSMRIADNLEENTSTFYAELSKLKAIIDAVNAGEPVFLLLDEILRGTNSQDRQTGSKALIRQLVKQNATALLATHDLALTELEKEYPNALSNYHFDVSVAKEELFFDYKLKTGICTSMNASILMKKIGIEIT